VDLWRQRGALSEQGRQTAKPGAFESVPRWVGAEHGARAAQAAPPDHRLDLALGGC
jgi:hypothetical protein